MANKIDPLALPTNQIVFASREALTLVLRLYNELSTPDSIVDVNPPDMWDAPQGQVRFAGYHPWQVVMVYCPTAEIEDASQKIQLMNIALAILYDPADRHDGFQTIYVIVKNGKQLDKALFKGGR